MVRDGRSVSGPERGVGPCPWPDRSRAVALALVVLFPYAGCVRGGFDEPRTEILGHDAAGADAARDAAPPEGSPGDRGLAADTVPADARPGDARRAPGSWVEVPAGTFLMGSPTTEACRYEDETQHAVTLARRFEMQSTEVTREQFAGMMGYDLSSVGDCASADCPVGGLSWHEAAAYCNALSLLSGLPECYDCSGSGAAVSCGEALGYAGAQIFTCPGYRLPTEAEWERAYRAGAATAYPNGANDPNACECAPVDARAAAIAWYCGNASDSAHPVGQKQANPYGLHDLAGNVWEWCHDRHQPDLGSAEITDPWGPATGADRVVRGGAVYSSARALRAAHRSAYPAGDRRSTTGVRCVRTL